MRTDPFDFVKSLQLEQLVVARREGRNIRSRETFRYILSQSLRHTLERGAILAFEREEARGQSNVEVVAHCRGRIVENLLKRVPLPG
jgi:hypothetical protein